MRLLVTRQFAGRLLGPTEMTTSRPCIEGRSYAARPSAPDGFDRSRSSRTRAWRAESRLQWPDGAAARRAGASSPPPPSPSARLRALTRGSTKDPAIFSRKDPRAGAGAPVLAAPAVADVAAAVLAVARVRGRRAEDGPRPLRVVVVVAVVVRGGALARGRGRRRGRLVLGFAVAEHVRGVRDFLLRVFLSRVRVFLLSRRSARRAQARAVAGGRGARSARNSSRGGELLGTLPQVLRLLRRAGRLAGAPRPAGLLAT